MSDYQDFKAVRVAENEWMAFTDSAARFIHRQVLELGYRHDPEFQTHRFAGSPTGALAGLALKWQPVEDVTPAPGEEQVPDISGLSLAQKSALAEQLTRDGVGGFGAPGPAPESDAAVGSALLPGVRLSFEGKVREVVSLDGEWVHVVDPESGRKARMKAATLEGWERL